MVARKTGTTAQLWLGGPVPADPETPDVGDGVLVIGFESFTIPDESQWIVDSATGDLAVHSTEVLPNFDWQLVCFVDPDDTALAAALASRDEVETHLRENAADTADTKSGMFVYTAARAGGVGASIKLNVTARYRGPVV